MTIDKRGFHVRMFGFTAVLALLGACGDKGANLDSEAGSESEGTETDEGSEMGDGDGDGDGDEGDGDGDDTGGNQQCDPMLQDCPDGFKCTAYVSDQASGGWDANKCVPEPDNGGVAGDPCTADYLLAIDSCAEGYICLDADENGENGACIEFCSPDMTCPNTSGGDGICTINNDGVLPICLTLCDPLLQDCPGQAACYGTDQPPFVCFGPSVGDGGHDGDACYYANSCLEGLNCAPAETQENCVTDQYGCCTPFCALDGDGCAGGEECIPYFPTPQPGYENVGICALPS